MLLPLSKWGWIREEVIFFKQNMLFLYFTERIVLIQRNEHDIFGILLKKLNV